MSLRDYAYQRDATEKREEIRLALMAANHRAYDHPEAVTDG